MAHPVLIKNDIVAFSLLQDKPNRIPTWLNIEQLFTPCGFVLPLSLPNMAIVDWIDYGDAALRDHHVGLRGLIVSYSGRIREYTLIWDRDEGCSNKMVTVVPTGPGIQYTRAMESEQDEIISTLAMVSSSAQEAIQRYGDSYPIDTRGYVFVHREDIVAEIRRRGHSFEFHPGHKGLENIEGPAVEMSAETRKVVAEAQAALRAGGHIK